MGRVYNFYRNSEDVSVADIEEKHPRLRFGLGLFTSVMLSKALFDYFMQVQPWTVTLIYACGLAIAVHGLLWIVKHYGRKHRPDRTIQIENALGTRPAFVALFFVCVLSVHTVKLAERPYWAVGYFLFVGLPGLLRKDAVNWGSIWAKLLFDGFFATLFALLFVVAQQDLLDVAALVKGVGKGAFVALIVMAVDRVGQSANTVAEIKSAANDVLKKSETATEGLVGHAASLQKTSENVTSMIMRAEQAIHAARYAGVAARVLRLREDALLADGKPDPGMLAATESANDAMRSWVLAGQSVRGKDQRSVGAWWKIMEIYHQEEAYDVSQFEIATNVRNFAFILIGTIGRYLETTQAHPPSNRRLVVANVTPFAPKDLFNYPNGSRLNRFYHEPEFYGTYRRVMSSIAAHPSVCTLRVTLAASDPASSAPHGWPLDSVAKLALDCSRMRLLPTPIRISRQSTDDSAPSSIRRPSFPQELAKHDPLVRLPPATTHYYWNPISVNLYDIGLDEASDEKIDWYTRARRFSPQARSSQEAVESVGQQFLSLISEYDEARRDAWKRMLERSPGWIDLAKNAPEHAQTLRKYVEHSPEAGVRTSNELEQAVVKLSELVSCVDARDLDSYVGRLRALYQCQERLEAIVSHGEFEKSADVLLDLVEICHDIDARAKVIEQKPPGTGGIVSSSGLQLGYAENWLYATLVWFQASRYRDTVKRMGFLPTWKALAVELCGVDLKELGGADEKLIDELLERFVVCTIGDASRNLPVSTTFEDMQVNSISQEFLLIGEAPIGAGPTLTPEEVSKVEWRALITADVQEPFHTCRVKVRFYGDKDLDAHAKWFDRVWRDRTANETFKELLRKELLTSKELLASQADAQKRLGE